MTASLALRGHARICEATRERVLAEATKQGYAANPMLGAWMSRVRKGKTEGDAAPVIAYVTGHPARAQRATPHLRLLLDGVRKRTAELGFKLCVFTGAGRQNTWSALAENFRKNAVVGLILAPFPESSDAIDLPWDRYCLVAVGHSAPRPALHTITDEKLKSTQNALDHLSARGYRRIGMVTVAAHEKLHSHGRTAAYLQWQQKRPQKRRLPPLRLEDIADPSPLRPWLRRHLPEIILSPYDLRETLHQQTPDGASPDFFYLGMSGARRHLSSIQGVLEPNFEMGIAAADTLAGLVYRYETGPPQPASTIEIPGRLHPAPSGSTIGHGRPTNPARP